MGIALDPDQAEQGERPENGGRPAGSVRVTLHRIRLLLLACINRTLAAKAGE